MLERPVCLPYFRKVQQATGKVPFGVSDVQEPLARRTNSDLLDKLAVTVN